MMGMINRCKAHMVRVWTHPHSRRSIVLKGIVSGAIGAHYLLPELLLPLALLGNFIWIWVDFEDPADAT